MTFGFALARTKAEDCFLLVRTDLTDDDLESLVEFWIIPGIATWLPVEDDDKLSEVPVPSDILSEFPRLFSDRMAAQRLEGTQALTPAPILLPNCARLANGQSYT